MDLSKAQQLRIGNRILVMGIETTVVAISEKWVRVSNVLPIEIYHFHRVPLTEERMIQLGFFQRKHNRPEVNGKYKYSWFKDGFEVRLEQYGNDQIWGYVFVFGANTIVLETLDQLQNLFFFLCGEELIPMT